MIRDSSELQAREDGVDSAFPETRIFAEVEGTDPGKKGRKRSNPCLDPVASLRAYLAKIDR